MALTGKEKYARRIAAALAKGYTRSQARGHPKANERHIEPERAKKETRFEREQREAQARFEQARVQGEKIRATMQGFILRGRVIERTKDGRQFSRKRQFFVPSMGRDVAEKYLDLKESGHHESAFRYALLVPYAVPPLAGIDEWQAEYESWDNFAWNRYFADPDFDGIDYVAWEGW